MEVWVLQKYRQTILSPPRSDVSMVFSFSSYIYHKCGQPAQGVDNTGHSIRLQQLNVIIKGATPGVGGSGPPQKKNLDGPPQLFDEECDYRYVTDCSP